MKFGRIQTDQRNVDGEAIGEQNTVEVTVEQNTVWLRAWPWDLVDQGVTVPLDAASLAQGLAKMLLDAAAWADAQ